MWDSKANNHNSMMDNKGRAWLAATGHKPDNPELCKNAWSHPYRNATRQTASHWTISRPVSAERPWFALLTVVLLITRRPAQASKLPAGTLSAGTAAHICIFDPHEAWTYDVKTGFIKSANAPWHGQTLHGRVKYTIVDGKVVYENGTISQLATLPQEQRTTVEEGSEYPKNRVESVLPRRLLAWSDGLLRADR